MLRLACPWRLSRNFGYGFLALLFFSASPTQAQTSPDAFYGIAADGVCEAGACPPSAAAPDGTDVSEPFNFTVTLADTDKFQVAGNYNITNSGCNSTFVPPYSVQYLGNALDGNAPSQNDTITIDALANITYCNLAAVDITYLISGSFGGDISPTSSIQSADSTDLVTVNFGPFSPPEDFSQTVVRDNLPVSDNTIPVDTSISFSFGEGSAVGSYGCLRRSNPSGTDSHADTGLYANTDSNSNPYRNSHPGF